MLSSLPLDSVSFRIPPLPRDGFWTSLLLSPVLLFLIVGLFPSLNLDISDSGLDGGWPSSVPSFFFTVPLLSPLSPLLLLFLSLVIRKTMGPLRDLGVTGRKFLLGRRMELTTSWFRRLLSMSSLSSRISFATDSESESDSVGDGDGEGDGSNGGRMVFLLG